MWDTSEHFCHISYATLYEIRASLMVAAEGNIYLMWHKACGYSISTVAHFRQTGPRSMSFHCVTALQPACGISGPVWVAAQLDPAGPWPDLSAKLM